MLKPMSLKENPPQSREKKTSSRGRLDRFIARHCQVPKKAVRMMLAEGRVTVDGERAKSVDQTVDEFSRICLDGDVLQASEPVYLVMNKPVGVVSATRDGIHRTVLDLIDHPQADSLHIVGRLDLNTSGLLLLTNDSRWSEKLMAPEFKVDKHYSVTLANPVSEDYIEAFAGGMYFAFEDITTAPAKLEILSEHVTRVILTEGKYHQIKRMFGRFRNPVVGLHRERVGALALEPALAPGQYRTLTAGEVSGIFDVQAQGELQC